MSHAIIARLQAEGLPKVAPFWLVGLNGITANLHIARSTKNMLADLIEGNK